MTMLLAIDIGNTNIVFALCEGEKTAYQWRIATNAHRTQDEYAVWLFSLMHDCKVARKDISAVAISSVVPEVNFAIRQFSRSYLKIEPMLISAGDVVCDMPVRIESPRELGADRLINAYAAWHRYKCALIVVDFGTATTFDVVSDAGEYLGGVIAPGIQLSLDALHHAAAKLPGIAIVKPEKVIGTNTVGAMQSGIFFGYSAMIEGIVTRIKAEHGCAMKVIATGGLAPLYAQATSAIDMVDEDVTIRGLRLIYHLRKQDA
jgi:type III pantothenate kinase